MFLTSLNKQYTEMRAIKLDTNLSNNQTKYEVLLLGLKLAHDANITALNVYNDSQLVINQVQGTYAVHSGNLQTYVEKVKQWKDRFNPFNLSLIGRKDNQTVDSLAKIASGETPNEEYPNRNNDESHRGTPNSTHTSRIRGLG